MGGKRIDTNDIIGNVYGRLTVTDYDGFYSKSEGRKEHYYLCKCDCGNSKVILRKSLLNSTTLSCGCVFKEKLIERNTKHGMSTKKIYQIYNSMVARCKYESASGYSYYGGKGIEIYPLWLGDEGFKEFYEWAMLNGYNEGLSIDRKDSNKDYCPKNCRWVELEEQMDNMPWKRVVSISEEGIEVVHRSVSKASEITGISKYGIYQCLNLTATSFKGWKFRYQ